MGVLAGSVTPMLGINGSFGCRIGTKLFVMWGGACQGSCSAPAPRHPDTEVVARDGAAGSAAAPRRVGVREKGLCYREMLFLCLFLVLAVPK